MKKEDGIERVAHAEISESLVVCCRFSQLAIAFGACKREAGQSCCSINTFRRRCPSLSSVQQGLLTKVARF